MVEDILIVGAGGHCRFVLSVLSKLSNYRVVGIADSREESIGERIGSSQVTHSFDQLEAAFASGITAAALAVGDNRERQTLYAKLKKIGFELPTLVHPKALIEETASVSEASIVGMGAMIGAFVSIAENCVVYTGAIVEHESRIGPHAFLAPGSVIAGRVTVGPSAFVGAGSVVIEKLEVGSGSIIGAGSVAIRSVLAGTKVAGSPAKPLK